MSAHPPNSCHCNNTPPCYNSLHSILFQVHLTLDPLGAGWGGQSEVTYYGASGLGFSQNWRSVEDGNGGITKFPTIQSASVRLAVEPTGTCYLKTWINLAQWVMLPDTPNPQKSALGPYIWNPSSIPCRRIGPAWESAPYDIGAVIWSYSWPALDYYDPEASRGIPTTVSFHTNKWSCIEWYTPSDSLRDNGFGGARPCPDPLPNGFPDDPTRPSKKGCTQICDTAYDPDATCETDSDGTGTNPCSGINNDDACPPWY